MPSLYTFPSDIPKLSLGIWNKSLLQTRKLNSPLHMSEELFSVFIHNLNFTLFCYQNRFPSFGVFSSFGMCFNP